MEQYPQHGPYSNNPYQHPTDPYGYPVQNPPYPDKNAIPVYGYPVQGHQPQAAPLLDANSNGPILRPARRASNRVFGWKWEIVTLLSACGALVAMVVVLVHFDGKRVPDWPLAINLTTLVALISTFFRAALLAVMAEIISQAKWLWFGKSRRLMDLQRFDEASRSFAGALKFFGTVPKTVIGSFGAAVVIASAAIGPFSQQAIKTVVCQEPNPTANASIPVAQFATGAYFRYGAGLWQLEADVQGALVNAVANPMGRDSGISATCATGNCTFPEHGGITHSSMGLCSACTDITRYLTVNDTLRNSINYTLPKGPYINTGSQAPAISVQQDYLPWLPPSALGSSAPYFSAALANITFLTFTRSACSLSPDVPTCQNNLNVSVLGTKMRPLATSCAIYPCLKHFHGTVSKGELSETLVSTVPATPLAEGTYSVNSMHNHTVLKTPCVINNNLYDASNFSLLSSSAHSFEHVMHNGANISAPFECIYKLSWVYGMALSDYLQDSLFNGYCVEGMSTPGTLRCWDSFWFYRFWSGGWSNTTWIEGVMANFTEAATNKLRLDGRSLYQGGARPDAQGAAYDTTVCVQLDWVWLLFPAGLLGAGLLLLVGIIVSGWVDGGPVWKSSLLPLLFCGLVEPQRFEEAPGERELVARAKGMTFVLRREGGAGFVRTTG